MLYVVAVFAPLVGALISGLLGRVIGDRAAQGASILGMVIAAICGPVACFQLLNGDMDMKAFHTGTLLGAGCGAGAQQGTRAVPVPQQLSVR